ncbi:MAG: acetone carboxylase [Kineosporiaceae bacterium]|nr:acetone carboxylase [Aeromicrobium sp.]
MTDELICSARSCGEAATYELVWNNPKVHTPDRRKIWLACDVHEETLRAFLSARGFWKETVPMASDAF